MAIIVNRSRITMPKGDSGSITLGITDDGSAYVPPSGISVLFQVKKHAADTVALISKDVTATITAGVATVKMGIEDTANLDTGIYVYGFALAGVNDKDSFIPKANLILTQGVVS